MKLAAVASVLVAAALVGPTAASAQSAGHDGAPAFSIGAQPVWFLTGGVLGGGTVAVADRGAFFGGDVVLVRIRGSGFVGFRGDAQYDFGTEGAYAGLAVEAGWVRPGLVPIGVGVDVGPALGFAGDAAVGASGRLFVSVAGMLTLYGRYYHFGTGDNEQIVQAGLSLKFPLAAPFGDGR